MKYLVVVVLLAVVLLTSLVEGRRRHHDRRHDRRHAAQERLHEYRVVNQNLHLDLLEKEIEELEEQLEELSPFPDEDETDELLARLDNLDNDTCDYWEDGEVSCGGEVDQCISHLFICDGHEDCRNGHDEDEDFCNDDVYHVGSTFAGVTEWHDCFTHAPHNTVITITANTQPEAFPSRTYLKAVVSFEIDDDHDLVETFKAKGYWNPARHALVLIPEDDEAISDKGFGIICRFIFGTNDRAECKIGTVGSRHECATFHAHRP